MSMVELGHEDWSDYRRELDISRAIQTVSYTSGGVRYTREYFASYPAQVMVFRLSADKPGSLSGSIRMDSMHRSVHAKQQGQTDESIAAIKTTASGNTINLNG